MGSKHLRELNSWQMGIGPQCVKVRWFSVFTKSLAGRLTFHWQTPSVSLRFLPCFSAFWPRDALAPKATPRSAQSVPRLTRKLLCTLLLLRPMPT